MIIIENQVSGSGVLTWKITMTADADMHHADENYVVFESFKTLLYY